MSRKLKATKNNRDKLYVMSAFSMLLVLFALYIYFVSVSVLHVVMQQEMQRNMSQLQTEISKLEAEYISAQHALSMNIASLDGYIETDNKIFIDRSDTTVALSQNTVR